MNKQQTLVILPSMSHRPSTEVCAGDQLQRYGVFLNSASFKAKNCINEENIACNCKKARETNQLLGFFRTFANI